ncbi:MAG: hypothetical protein JWP07_2744 [Pseudonocardiales bacterium]|nr:hypothetical protein [Pseudonocardiales bacterium]
MGRRCVPRSIQGGGWARAHSDLPLPACHPVQLDDLDRVHGWPRCEVVLDDEDVPAILKVSCAYVGGKDYLVL